MSSLPIYPDVESFHRSRWATQLPIYIATIPSAYVLGRLSPVFPATAIDQNESLKSAWDMTRGNGWRMLIVVGLLPWIIGVATSLLLRTGASIIEVTVITVLTYLLLVVEVVALSLAYKELVGIRDKKVNQEPVV